MKLTESEKKFYDTMRIVKEGEIYDVEFDLTEAPSAEVTVGNKTARFFEIIREEGIAHIHTVKIAHAQPYAIYVRGEHNGCRYLKYLRI
jgi:hypothetical protein